MKHFLNYEWLIEMVETLRDGKFTCLVITDISNFMLHIDKIRENTIEIDKEIERDISSQKYKELRKKEFAFVKSLLPTYNFSE